MPVGISDRTGHVTTRPQTVTKCMQGSLHASEQDQNNVLNARFTTDGDRFAEGLEWNRVGNPYFFLIIKKIDQTNTKVGNQSTFKQIINKNSVSNYWQK